MASSLTAIQKNRTEQSIHLLNGLVEAANADGDTDSASSGSDIPFQPVLDTSRGRECLTTSNPASSPRSEPEVTTRTVHSDIFGISDSQRSSEPARISPSVCHSGDDQNPILQSELAIPESQPFQEEDGTPFHASYTSPPPGENIRVVGSERSWCDHYPLFPIDHNYNSG
jgi:hypothetical protein